MILLFINLYHIFNRLDKYGFSFELPNYFTEVDLTSFEIDEEERRKNGNEIFSTATWSVNTFKGEEDAYLSRELDSYLETIEIRFEPQNMANVCCEFGITNQHFIYVYVHDNSDKWDLKEVGEKVLGTYRRGESDDETLIKEEELTRWGRNVTSFSLSGFSTTYAYLVVTDNYIFVIDYSFSDYEESKAIAEKVLDSFTFSK